MKCVRVCAGIAVAVGLTAPLIAVTPTFASTTQRDRSVSASGVSIRVPSGWEPVAGTKQRPRVLLRIGTHANPARRCDVRRRGTSLTLLEFPSVQAGAEFVVPGSSTMPGGVSHAESLAEVRPLDFANPLRSTAETSCSAPGPHGYFDTLMLDRLFTDQGRTFVARVVTTDDDRSTAVLTTAYQVLNTLEVKPRR